MYKTEELEKLSLKAIKKHDIVFIDELSSYLPCDRTTFYAHDLHKNNSIKEALLSNRVSQKAEIRKKWRLGDNPTTDIALYKLLATDEERDALSNARPEKKEEKAETLVFKVSCDG